MLGTSSIALRRVRTYAWPTLLIGVLLAKAILSLALQQTTMLTAYSNVTYFVLLLLATGLATLNAVQNIQGIRSFWALLGVGFVLWSVHQWIWLYYQVGRQVRVPDDSIADASLFLHLVPFMAAIATLPHLNYSSLKVHRIILNFLLLFFSWVFLYAYLLFPYQYLVWDESVYNFRYNTLYLVENLALILALAILSVRTKFPWRGTYRQLLGASALYAASSAVANFAMDSGGYSYSSVYALGQQGAACWFIWILLLGRHPEEVNEKIPVGTIRSRYTSISAMVAVLAISSIGIFELFQRDELPHLHTFQLLVVIVFVVCLAILLFVRDYFTSTELASDVDLATEQLRLAMQSGKSVGWDWNPKTGRAVWFGDLRTMFGISSDTYSGRVEDFYHYVHPEDREQVLEAVACARQTHAPHALEFRILWPDGTLRWAAATGKFCYAKHGGPERMLGTAIDVTERKLAEEQLRASGEHSRRLVQSSSVPMIVTRGIEQQNEAVNEAFTSLFGYNMEDVPDVAHWWSLAYPDEDYREAIRSLWQTRVEEAIRNKTEIEPVEATVRCKDGSTRDIQAHFSCVGDKNLVTLIDLTQRKRAEEALRESERRFRLVANTAPVMIWMAGPNKQRDYFNQTWLDFTGRPIEMELGNGWADSIHPEDRITCLETYTKAVDTRQPFKMQYRLLRHDGQYRWVLSTAVPRFNHDGSFAGYIGASTDITERRLSEEALSTVSRRLIEAQEEERSRIARELHDDINQDIALLAIELESLRQELPASAHRLRAGLQSIQDHILHTSRDIQAISHRLHSSKLDYLGLASASGSFCRELAEQRKVEITFTYADLPEHLPREVALSLFRVLQEALQNAIKHSGAYQFTAELRALPQEIQLTVSDPGVGFDPELALRSRGLGLVSMRERLQLVNGKMTIESQPKCGTTIRAAVPLKPTA